MTPKQRRQQDIFKRKTKAISEGAKGIKGNISERERESLGEQMPMSGMGLEDETLEPGLEGAAQGAVGEAVTPKKKMGGGMMNEYKKGGMVRGQGIALRGTKFKGIF